MNVFVEKCDEVECNNCPGIYMCTGCWAKRIEQAKAEEGEACAKLCDELVAANRAHPKDVFGILAAVVGEDIARAIRARAKP